MKVHNYFLIFIIGAISTFAMELPEAEKRGAKRPAEQEITIEQEGVEPIALKQAKVAEAELPAQASLEALPAELREIIYANLYNASGATPQIRLTNAAQNIRNLFMINKEYKENYLDNVELAGAIIMGLAREFAKAKKQKEPSEKDIIMAALAFATNAASKWIGLYSRAPVISMPITKEQSEEIAKYEKIKAALTDILINAAKERDASTIRFIFSNARELVNFRSKDIQGDTLLTIAAETGNEPLVGELLKFGANPNLLSKRGYAPIWFAAGSGNLAMLNQLLAAEANLQQTGSETLLMNAENAAIAQRLIALGVPVNAETSLDNDTALHYAVRNKRPDVVQVLLAAGADPNIENTRGFSPLHEAVEVDDARIITQLIQGGANKEAVTVAGLTPLAFAVQSGKLAAIKALLEAGANQNAVLPSGQGRNAPLFQWVLFNEKFPIAELFIAHGADVNKLTSSGVTLLKGLQRAAGTPRNDRIVKFLIDHGAHE